MSMRTLILAGALTAGLGSTAMAQGITVDTPFFGFSTGPSYYEPYGAYAYSPGWGPAYVAPGYAYGPSRGGWRRGHRADSDIYTGYGYWGGHYSDAYKNQTGVNSN